MVAPPGASSRVNFQLVSSPNLSVRRVSSNAVVAPVAVGVGFVGVGLDGVGFVGVGLGGVGFVGVGLDCVGFVGVGFVGVGFDGAEIGAVGASTFVRMPQVADTLIEHP